MNLTDRLDVGPTERYEPVVIVSLEDYQSLKETAHLLRNPANARRLLRSIDRLENGDGTARELVE